MHTLRDAVFQIITEYGPISTKEIQNILQKQRIHKEREEINSLLYGELRNVLIRDVNEDKIPIWRIRSVRFEAATGLEKRLFENLIMKGIIPKEKSWLNYGIRNRRNNKVYHLDIAVLKDNTKYTIEVDGFDHIRADALASLERQIIEKNPEIEIDWMDNAKSFVTYSEINTSLVYKWCATHLDWCIRFHEELLWPKDITRNLWLIESGWKIIRFWNAEVHQNIDRCIKEIDEWMNDM